MNTRLYTSAFSICVSCILLLSFSDDRSNGGEPETRTHKSPSRAITNTNNTRALFMYDSTGLHTYDFSTKKFAFFGDLIPDDPDQHVRALDFAVRSSDKTICVVDGQERGYPFYSCDLNERRLYKVGDSGEFLYSSISHNPQNGLLYGVIWAGPRREFLAILDPKSGGFHRIAPIVTGAKIAFAPNGDLYAIISGGYLDSEIENGQLYKIDVETGQDSLVGKVELDYKSSRFTISQDGIGYLLEHTGKLRLINLQTSESKLLGDSGCRDAFGIFEYEVPEGSFLSFQQKGGQED